METGVTAVSSEARVTTTLAARRYLGQLCKHFQHKLPVTVDEQFTAGRIEFSAGHCELAVGENENVLIMRGLASTPADLERVQDVIARHLERFAFRESLSVIWEKSA